MTGLEPTQKDYRAGKAHGRDIPGQNEFPQMRPLYSNHRTIAGECGEHEI